MKKPTIEPCEECAGLEPWEGGPVCRMHLAERTFQALYYFAWRPSTFVELKP